MKAVFVLALLYSVSAVARVQQTEIEQFVQEGNSEGNSKESRQHRFKSRATSGLPSATMSMKDLVPLLHALEIGKCCCCDRLYVFHSPSYHLLLVLF